MATSGSVAAGCGYVVTDAGRDAANDSDGCRCVPQVDGGLLACSSCGTVYAVLRQTAMFNDRSVTGLKRKRSSD